MSCPWDSPNPSYPKYNLRERFFCLRQPMTVRAETYALNRKALAMLDDPFMGPQKPTQPFAQETLWQRLSRALRIIAAARALCQR